METKAPVLTSGKRSWPRKKEERGSLSTTKKKTGSQTASRMLTAFDEARGKRRMICSNARKGGKGSGRDHAKRKEKR